MTLNTYNQLDSRDLALRYAEVPDFPSQKRRPVDFLLSMLSPTASQKIFIIWQNIFKDTFKVLIEIFFNLIRSTFIPNSSIGVNHAR